MNPRLIPAVSIYFPDAKELKKSAKAIKNPFINRFPGNLPI